MAAVGKEIVSQTFDDTLIVLNDEAVYSDDSLPGATDAVLGINPTVTIIGTELEREVSRPFWGNAAKDLVGKFVQLDFEVEMTGAGAAGNIPGISQIMKMAGHAETNNIGVDTIYDPASTAIKSSSVYFYIGTDLWKLVGARADYSESFSAQQWFKAKVTITGLFALPVHNATIPTPTYSNHDDPLPVSYINTPTATLHGQSVAINQWEFSVGNIMELIDVPEGYSVNIAGRNPSASMTIEAIALDVFNPWSVADAKTKGAVSIQHGVAAGSQILTSLPTCALLLNGMQNTKLGENRKGIVIPLNPLPSTGDDEYQKVWS
ncbi:MAG: hypothetical protein ACN4GR_01655 [Arenicellales bacterium]